MEGTRPRSDSLFTQLNGPTAHALIVIGLVLLLAAPLIPRFKMAKVSKAEMEYTQIDSLMALDLEDLTREQEKDRKADQEAAQKESSEPFDYSQPQEEIEKHQKEIQTRQEARIKREADRQKAFDDKRDELKKKYDSHDRKRALLTAQMAATGMRWHLLVAFLGNAMLLVGLLVVTLESEGARQKVALVILLVVMFSALSGVSVNMLALGSLGDEPPGFDRMLKSQSGNVYPN